MGINIGGVSSMSAAYVGNTEIMKIYVGGNLVWEKQTSPTYTLTVINSTGTGEYAAGTLIQVSADPPAEGYQFKEWIGDSIYLDNPQSSIVNLTMPAADISIEATYELIQPETVTIGGEEYETVTIGTQTWLKRNLHYNDSGVGIYSYNNDTGISDVYGYLYTWDAAMRVDALIDGWHLPSYAELETLSDYLGATAGGKLKETGISHWATPNTGATNESGFTALGSGERRSFGTYRFLTARAAWWTTNQISTDSYHAWILFYDSDEFGSGGQNKNDGIPLRLIKDTP